MNVNSPDNTTGQEPTAGSGRWPVPRTDLSALETEPDRRHIRERARFHITLGALRAALEEEPTPNLVRAAGRRWIAAAAQITDEVASKVQQHNTEERGDER